MAISSPDRPLHLSPPLSQPLKLRGTYSVFYLPQYIPVPSACCHCPHIYQAGPWGGSGRQLDKTPAQVSSPLPWKLWLQGKGSDIPLSLPTTTLHGRSKRNQTRGDRGSPQGAEVPCSGQNREERPKKAPSLLTGSSEAMRPSPHEPGPSTQAGTFSIRCPGASD